MSNLDPTAEFEALKTRVLAAISAQFPVQGRRRRLEISDISVEDASSTESPYHVDNATAQEEAKLAGGTWAIPVAARLSLVDNATGTVLNQSTMTVARIPKLTRRYTYIVAGHERQHDSTFRLVSRPYHFVDQTGTVIARWNLESGVRFDIIMGSDGLIRWAPKGGGKKVPIYSVLRVLGVSDAEMRESWGTEVFKTNQAAAKYEKDVESLAATFRKPRDPATPTLADKEALVRTGFSRALVNPAGMELAFGKPDTHVTGTALLRSSDRVLGLFRGKEEPDDRQSLENKGLYGTDDYILDAIAAAASDIKRKILAKIDKDELTTVRQVFSPYMYSKAINKPFEHSQRPEQTNPLHMLSGYQRTTILGEHGGMKNSFSLDEKDKQINPSHLGFLDVIPTPESEATGIDLRLPIGVTRSGNVLKIRVYDVKQQKMVEATAGMLSRTVVAYPDQVRWKGGVPHPVSDQVVVYDSDRRTAKSPWSRVQYVLPSAKTLFSFTTNMIPFLQNNSGNRAMMAAKQQEQAVALKYREPPLVQTKTDGNATFENVVGTLNAHISPIDGTVTEVTDRYIAVRGTDGTTVKVHLYNNFPLNGKGVVLDSETKVKVGQQVVRRQLLADTNYTKNGNLSLGVNLRVAYVPYRGYSVEDGIVVSATAAKRLTSIHLHKETAFKSPASVLDVNLWTNYTLPERHTPERVAKLDATGVIRPGQKVSEGDVLVAMLAPVDHSSSNAQALRSIGRALAKDYRDQSLIWDHHAEGVVAKVVRRRDGIDVYVRTEEPLVIGDKLTGRYGNKGIVSKILADHEMPRDKDGKPVEILLSPASIVSRMNIGQVLEAAASKIAEKRGQPYVTENFVAGRDYTGMLRKELANEGIDDNEELFDPTTGRSIGNVAVGKLYTLKLHHQVEKKMTARSVSGAYDQVAGDAPSGSGIPGGGQKFDQLLTYAMLAHGANHNIAEAQTIKSDSEAEDFWAAVIAGRDLPAPAVNRGLRNFQQYLRATNISADRHGTKYVLSPFTDAQTEAISNGKLDFPDGMLHAKGIRTIEEAGGIFDPAITGGLNENGKYWSHIKMPLRMPNPVFREAIASLLQIKEKEYDRLVSPEGLTDGQLGTDWIVQQLRKLNVSAELEKTEKSLANIKPGPLLDRAYRRARYLRSLKKLGLSAVDAYSNQYVPVIPPKMRPVAVDFAGQLTVDDLNWLYKNVGVISTIISKQHKSTPIEEQQKQAASLYDALTALKISGLDLNEGGKTRHVRGLMESLTGQGDSPKGSLFQDGVLGRRQDLSARSTIIPEPALSLDEIGVPVPVAFEMFSPFIARELVQSLGVTPAQAYKMVKQRTESARSALDRVVESRPVLSKRDPVLHSMGVMAFRAKLVPGKAIALHPLVCAGFNADFDGDTMSLFVPVSDQAIEEAYKMFPSKNLFSATHGGLVPIPIQDSLLGLFQMTKWGEKGAPDLTAANAVSRFKAGKAKASDVFVLDGKETTVGRYVLSRDLPVAMQGHTKLLHDKGFLLAKGNLRSILTEIAKSDPAHYGRTVDAWKNYGAEAAYLNGSSFSLKDFHDGKDLRDEILVPFRKREAEIRNNAALKPSEKDAEVLQTYIAAMKELKARGEARYKAGENRVYEWARSGARADWDQFGQLVMGPILVNDAANRPVPVPITHSFGEGLTVSEYLTSMHGARKGALDRAQGTKDPGAKTKEIVNTVINEQISMVDCGTTEGVVMALSEHDIGDRYTAKPVTLPTGEVIPAETMLTASILTKCRTAGLNRLIVRSPLRCQAPRGICAKCFGLDENGRLRPVGQNIGVISGQALGEPITQLTMRTFHTGGAVSVDGGNVVGAFKRVSQLFNIPEKLPGAATLSTADGVITNVLANTALGGWDVLVGDTKHHVPAALRLLPTTAVGAAIRKGEPLSTGPTQPRDLMRITGSLGKVRNYLANELDRAYNDEKPLTKKRHIEVVVRTMTNVAQIHDAEDHPHWLRGQLARLSEVEEENRKRKLEGKAPIVATTKLVGLPAVPITATEDWMGRLNYQKLRTTLQEGAAQGWESDTDDSIIAAAAHGAGMGHRKTRITGMTGVV